MMQEDTETTENCSIKIAKYLLRFLWKCRIDDKRNEYKGYDLLCITESGEERYVEVKTLSRNKNYAKNYVEVTKNEFETAKKYKEKYWLCIIENPRKIWPLIQEGKLLDLLAQGYIILCPVNDEILDTLSKNVKSYWISRSKLKKYSIFLL